jgi:amidohydrolase
MASTDLMTIRVDGKGGHAARPHLSRDPVLAAAHLVVALQSIVSRNIDPLDSAVVSICGFQAATAHNVIPDSVELRGTARSFSPNVRDTIEQRVRAVSAGIAAAMDVAIKVDYQRGYPVLVNDPAATDVAIRAAAEVSGAAGVENSAAPVMIAEDFAYMLEARPGAFIFMGNGASEGLHQAGYDFDDRAAIYGASYWINLVQTTLGNRGP